MLFKLSLKNIKKSIKDYSIYFFTLVFAVAMFYMFNSVDAQTSMLSLNESKYEIIKSVVQIIAYVSVFVSVILGFLIVYSNNFLIKRRKREIGLYEILGMSKRKVSLILFIETVIVGIISLIIGLLLGIFLSQFLSIFISKLFEADLTRLKFIFSIHAFNKTILYFGIIFLFVIIFNAITLNRYKIIDLLTADRKNEQVKIRNKYLTIISMLLSLSLLSYAYYLLLVKNALLMFDKHFILMLLSGALGTFLLFFSLSGFLLKILEKFKKIYYKNLNIFILKQVNSKINTTVVSTTIICLMLLLTMCMLSGSMTLAKIYNDDLKENNLTDFTVKAYNINSEVVYEDGETYDVFGAIIPIEEGKSFEKLNLAINDKEFNNYVKEYVLFRKYADRNLNIMDIITKSDIKKLRKEYGNSISLDSNVSIIRKTDYINFMKLNNKDYIDIKDNEYLLLSNIEITTNSYKNFYENKNTITVNNKVLKPASDKIIETAYENYNTAGNDGLIVVSDEITNDLDLLSLSLVGNYVDNDNEEEYGDKFYEFLSSKTNYAFDFRSRVMMETSSLGIKVMVIFLGLYLGITFAISSATVLAIGQLSESSDNKKRYKILSQIGADSKIINKALFTQIAITFLFPLIVALIHSYFGLKKLNKLIISFGSVDLASDILFTAIFILIVYGGYFLLTYFCSKNIIKSKN